MSLGRCRDFSKTITAWSDVQWPLVEERIFGLQKRIFRKSQKLVELTATGKKISRNDRKGLYNLQHRLVTSPDAKLLAVKRVSKLNKGRRAPGVDRKSKLSSQERLELAKTLDLKKSAHLTHRVDIPKSGTTKTRSLGTLTMEDRALQMLTLMALEPEWEAKFEVNSYGFRPGQQYWDATSTVWHSLRRGSKYVLDANIAGCFNNISHELLLEKLETRNDIKEAVNGWLKVGKVRGFPQIKPENTILNVHGTLQCGVISPLLANIALHGLETATRDYYANVLYKAYGYTVWQQKDSNISVEDRQQQISFIRYADNFVVLHTSRDVIVACKNFINNWLKHNVGVELSRAKTYIVQSERGFTFLGFHFTSIKEKGSGKVKCRASISKKSKARLILKVRLLLRKGKSWSQIYIIKQLNPMVIGWCNYFCAHECSKDFKQVEGQIFKQLQHWALRRKARGLRGEKLLDTYFKDANISFRGTGHVGKFFCCSKRGCDLIYWVKPSFIASRRHNIKIKKGVPFTT